MLTDDSDDMEKDLFVDIPSTHTPKKLKLETEVS